MPVMTIIKDGKTYLTTQEACTFLGVSRQTVNRLVNEKKLHQFKQGVTRAVYYEQSELEAIASIQPKSED